MKLDTAINLHAESMVKEQKTTDSRKLNTLLSTHLTNVQKIVRQIKKDGDIIQMSNQSRPIKGEDPKSGYQTVIWHGMTRSAEKKTFVQTYPDSSIKTWTEIMS